MRDELSALVVAGCSMSWETMSKSRGLPQPALCRSLQSALWHFLAKRENQNANKTKHEGGNGRRTVEDLPLHLIKARFAPRELHRAVGWFGIDAAEVGTVLHALSHAILIRVLVCFCFGNGSITAQSRLQDSLVQGILLRGFPQLRRSVPFLHDERRGF